MKSIWTARRDTAEGKVAGVCAGLARHADIDPVLVRVGAVVLALSAGVGLVVYLIAWLFVPDEDGRVVIDQHAPAVRRWPRPLLVAALAVAGIAVIGILGSVIPFGIGPAVVLAAIWYFGYYRNRRREPAPPAAVGAVPPNGFVPFAGPPTPFTEAAAAWQRRMDEVRPGAAAPGPSPSAPPHPVPGRVHLPNHPVQPTYPPIQPKYQPTYQPAAQTPTPTRPVTDPRPAVGPEPYVGPWDAAPQAAPAGGAQRGAGPRPDALDPAARFLTLPDPVGLYTETPPPPVTPPHRRVGARRLRLVSLVVLGLVLAGLALADRAGVAVGATGYLAAALAVGGLTLLAAAFVGRARGILPVTALVAVAALGSTVSTAAQAQDWGWTERRYVALSELPVADQLNGGYLSVDLADLPVTDTRSYTAGLEYGELELIRPTASNVAIEWRVDEGTVDLPGQDTRSGNDLTGRIEPTGVRPGDPVLTVRLHVAHGQLEVR